MPVKLIQPTASAYVYPLLIKHLLHQPLTRVPDQEIVYRDLRRHTYREFRERIGRLASGLVQIGVEEGDTVAIMEWDSDRYHECYFAIPMMGAVMQTINVSLTPDDIAYTINDTARQRPVQPRLCAPLQAIAPARDGQDLRRHARPAVPPKIDLPVKAEYEALIEIGSPYYQFPDFDENASRHDFPHHRNDRTAERRLLQPSADRSAHALRTGRIRPDAEPGPLSSRRRLHAVDADVSCPCLGLPLHGDAVGRETGFSGRYAPDVPEADPDREGDVHPLRADDPADAARGPGFASVDLSGLKMVVGGSALPPSLARAAMARGIDVFAGYGLSEAGPMLTGSIRSRSICGRFEEEIRHRMAPASPRRWST